MESKIKCFYKKTRKRGKVVKIVEEKYYRSDIDCGYLFSNLNTNDHDDDDDEVMDVSASSSSIDANAGISVDSLKQMVHHAAHKQLLLIDTNIALHQIDVLEYNCSATSLVVVLQTVLQELKHLNTSVYRRMLELMKTPTKSFIFYPNEASYHTAVFREDLESPNDANDRAIVHAAKYFNDIIVDEETKVVFITNDLANKNRAIKIGLESFSMRQYVQQYVTEYPELLDLVAHDGFNTTLSTAGGGGGGVGGVVAQQPSLMYPIHLPMSEVLNGIKVGRYHRGIVRCQQRDCPFDCYVMLRSADKSADGASKYVLIQGEQRMNRAVNGDLVAIEILTTSTDDPHDATVPVKSNNNNNNSTSSSTIRDDNAVEVSADTAEPTAELLEGLVPSSSSTALGKQRITFYGRVVGIIKRNWRQYAGSLDAGHPIATETEMISSENAMTGAYDSSSVLFTPIDKSIPKILITTRRLEELVGQRLLVCIDQWPADSRYPLGHYVRVLGKEGDKSVETQVILHEYDVPHSEFTPAVMACLPAPGWKITPEVISQRTDLRHIPVCSIDPPGCKDIDDALHCVRLPNGRIEAGVHIADVTYFVHPDTAIDKEAAHRSTSTYLVDRRLDMLPGLLTTQLCSLRSSEEHLAFSILFEMDDEANIYDVKFCKSVIHSVASLTYDEAQSMLDVPDEEDTVNRSVNLLQKLAKILRQRRIDMGALTLASPEVRFKLDTETQNPTDVTMYNLKDSNALVEEWMLLANITVSKQILRFYPTLGILRRHQPPSRQQFAPLLSAALAVNCSLDITNSKTLADSLDRATRVSDPYFNKLLRILSTRCMMPAQYFCSGELPKDQWHHYGLAAPVYTHFTSPIRRYADILVHRLLAASIGVIPLPIANSDHIKQQELCSHMNRRHRAAQYVSRASVSNHTLLYFTDHPSTEVAYILSITEDRFSVLVPRFGIEGSIQLDHLKTALQADEVEFKAIEHRVMMFKRSSSSSSALVANNKKQKLFKATQQQQLISSEKEVMIVVLSLQVFDKVQISIKVHNSVSGSRKLVFSLLHKGIDLGTN